MAFSGTLSSNDLEVSFSSSSSASLTANPFTVGLISAYSGTEMTSGTW